MVPAPLIVKCLKTLALPLSMPGPANALFHFISTPSDTP
jgi:hypothetical protein